MNNSEPIRVSTMADATCDNPDCHQDHVLVLQQNCHPGAGLIAMYSKKHEMVRLTCASCKGFLADIAVAP